MANLQEERFRRTYDNWHISPCDVVQFSPNPVFLHVYHKSHWQPIKTGKA